MEIRVSNASASTSLAVIGDKDRTTYSCIEMGMSGANLAEFGLNCKPHVAKSLKWHGKGMAYEEKPINWAALANETHRIFVRRVREEMKKKNLSDNELTKLCKQKGFKIGQSSVSRLTAGRAGKQGLSLTNIHAVARGLETEVWELFKLAEGAKIFTLPPPPRALNPEPDRQESRLPPRRKRRR